MKIVSFDAVVADDWDDCCRQSSQAWLFHSAGWIQIEEKYFVRSNHSFSIVDKGEVLAVQPLYCILLGLGAWTETLLCSGLHRQTGLACRDNLSVQQLSEVKSVAMIRINEIARSLDADRIQLNVQNLTPESLSFGRQEIPFWVYSREGYFLGLNFSPSGMVPVPGMATCCADQIVDLRPTENELFSNLDEGCRRAVRKAIASDLIAEVCYGDTLTHARIGVYYELAQLSAQRTGEALAPRGYFEDLGSFFSASRNLAIVFVKHEEQPVAGVLLAIDKGAASYLGGVSNSDYLNLRINDFAHWATILWAKSESLQWYRLGPIFPELSNDAPINKVSRFKAKFGGRPFTVIQGSKFLNPDKYFQAGVEQIRCLTSSVYSG